MYPIPFTPPHPLQLCSNLQQTVTASSSPRATISPARLVSPGRALMPSVACRSGRTRVLDARIRPCNSPHVGRIHVLHARMSFVAAVYHQHRDASSITIHSREQYYIIRRVSVESVGLDACVRCYHSPHVGRSMESRKHLCFVLFALLERNGEHQPWSPAYGTGARGGRRFSRCSHGATSRRTTMTAWRR